jgi:hypothetical protein
MNIKRQYSLPNCTLTLEGLSNEITPGDSRPILSLLTYAQCQFLGSKKILHGGRAFLENLVRAVNSYAQECLSGVRHPQETSQGEDQIRVEGTENGGHRLIWYPAADAQESESPITLTISTVQLFDLVEAVDQFLNDTRTLPDLTLQLQPVSRRYRQGDEPIGKKVIPLALGVGSLALSGLILSFLPIPEVRQPQPKALETPGETQPTPETSPPR